MEFIESEGLDAVRVEDEVELVKFTQILNTRYNVMIHELREMAQRSLNVWYNTLIVEESGWAPFIANEFTILIENGLNIVRDHIDRNREYILSKEKCRREHLTSDYIRKFLGGPHQKCRLEELIKEKEYQNTLHNARFWKTITRKFDNLHTDWEKKIRYQSEMFSRLHEKTMQQCEYISHPAKETREKACG